MRAISKNPDDYLVGQPGHPARATRVGPPARVRIPVYVGTIVIATLLAMALGASWDLAFPIGLLTGALAQLALVLRWPQDRLDDTRLPTGYRQ